MTALFLFFSCGGGNKTENSAPSIERHLVAEEIVESANDDERGSAPFVLNEATFNGIFVPASGKHVTVTLSIGGIVKYTSLLPGNRVQKGELLATLENPEFINLQQNYLDACAQTEFLEAEYRRQELLLQQEAVSQRRLQESKAGYLSVKSRKDAAAAQLRMLGLSPQSVVENGISHLLEVRAPISGYIANMQMSTGKYIPAGEPLCELIDKSAPLLRLTAYEKDLKNISAGDKIQFTVNSMGSETFAGEIVSIGQQIDELSRSLDVYAKVSDNHSMFRPGMYVIARVVKDFL